MLKCHWLANKKGGRKPVAVMLSAKCRPKYNAHISIHLGGRAISVQSRAIFANVITYLRNRFLEDTNKYAHRFTYFACLKPE